MRIVVFSVSNRQPAWIAAGFDEYARRLRGGCSLELIEVALAPRRGSRPVARLVAEEGERLLAAVPKGAHVVALDVAGEHWSTTDLSARLKTWDSRGAPVALLIGGPDGLAAACLARAAERFALSRLTLPHGLARVVVAEAVYRAWSVLKGHPYHRA